MTNSYDKLLTGRKYPTKVKPRKRDTSPIWAKDDSNTRFSLVDISALRDICYERYFVSKQDGLSVNWIDSADKTDSGLLESKLSLNGRFKVTITLYLTNGSVLVQGNSLKEWMKLEYPALMNLYESHRTIYSAPGLICRSILNDVVHILPLPIIDSDPVTDICDNIFSDVDVVTPPVTIENSD